jgi:hypothetical protein
LIDPTLSPLLKMISYQTSDLVERAQLWLTTTTYLTSLIRFILLGILEVSQQLYERLWHPIDATKERKRQVLVCKV